ncbi:MAG: type II toxin-antitoxin system RelE/ParE family toxin [Pirellulaceae bacterium]|nr:type II toxin-antitoxin system RelE/ParE family toxin [Pirellulaceae bacterium]
MAKLRWSLQAATDLEEACEYIARDSEEYARLFAQQVMAILKSMAKERLPGSMVPEYGREEVRERLLHSYRIIVRVRARQGVLEVVRIFHGARLLPPLDG